MSQQLDTVAGSKWRRESMVKSIEACSAKDCGFCKELQKVLDEVKDATPLYLE